MQSKAHECTAHQLKELNKKSEASAEVHMVKKKMNHENSKMKRYVKKQSRPMKGRFQEKQSRSSCGRCGTMHQYIKCPALGHECKLCGRKKSL